MPNVNVTFESLTENMGVCALHRPPNYPTSFETRNPPVDEMPGHMKKHSFSSFSKDELVDKIKEALGHVGNVFKVDESANQQELLVFSQSRQGPVFDFSLFFLFNTDENKTNVTLEVFRRLKQITLKCLPSANKLHSLKDMTQIDAVVTCVKNFSDDSPSDPKEDFLCRQVQMMNMR